MATSLRWLARGEHELPADPSWLATGEAQLAAGLGFTKRRTEYLLRRWVGKQAVALASGAPVDLPELARIEVANRPSGAPYVLVDGRPSDLTVSLTDRAGWAVCLLGRVPARVGCDLELVEARSAGFVRDFLTPEEQRYVAGRASSDDRHAAANLLWSAKESALKVLGTGLRRDSRTVAVSVGDTTTDGWGALTVAPDDGAPYRGWWRREGVFLLTVAADRPLGSPTALPGCAELREATPVHSWVGT